MKKYLLIMVIIFCFYLWEMGALNKDGAQIYGQSRIVKTPSLRKRGEILSAGRQGLNFFPQQGKKNKLKKKKKRRS